MLLTILALAVAAPSAESTCLNATSTVAMVDCLAKATKTADARLNTAYRAARARVPAAQAQALQVAQRAWIAFRNANCRAYAAGEGTIARVETAQCGLDVTNSRAKELENFSRRM